MAVDRRLWRRMDRVVANSEETRSRIHSAGLRDRSAVDVARPGVDTDFYSPAYGPRRRQLLVAGRISWHKNIQLAIEASRILIDRRVEHDLVIAGFVDAKDEAYVAELRALAGGLPIQFRPDPSDADLRDLYRESEALLFTPHNEDFGLVPLEAMACGTPVISVDAGGPRETIVDGSTGWLVAPEPAAFAERIVALLTDPDRARFHTTARDRAVEFGWDRFVAQIDDVMQAVVSAKGRAG
jgi:glycosyltransferase involved in cell wall biosynthesis